MSEKIIKTMRILKTVFFVLLALEIIGLIISVINLLPSFGLLSEYGEIMLVAMSIIIAVMFAVMFFGIIAKILLIRSTSSAISGASGFKAYVALAVILLIFNVFAILMSLLSVGGEGATAFSQSQFFLQILASAVEIVALALYLGSVKKINSDK